MHPLARCSIALLLVAPFARTATAQCPEWKPGFELPGTETQVEALAVFDDGTGPALYAGGFSPLLGGPSPSAVARWDGSAWQAVGALAGSVRALLVHDDGGGPALYAGGSSGLGRWNGASWDSVAVTGGGWISCLAAFDDGSGAALYAGGTFTSIDGVAASRVARWDGASWTALGSGTDAGVLSMTSFDDGSGPALFVAGSFYQAGGALVDHVARWNGTSWSALGGGMDGTVFSLAVFDHGDGPALYAGGDFVHAGGDPIVGAARWNGAAWLPVGAGTGGRYVRSLAVIDEGGGARLLAGAYVTSGAAEVLAFDGRTWSGDAVAFGPEYGGFTTRPEIHAVSAFDDGAGSRLFVAGTFLTVGELGAHHVAARGPEGWSVVGSGAGISSPFDYPSDGTVVQAAAAADVGLGLALYVGGSFQAAGDVAARNVAAWNGAGWSPLGSGTDNRVRALAVFDHGQGPALYVAGDFVLAGGILARHVARWDGGGWSALGSGTDYPVHALCVFDDGSGPALYAGGNFSTAGGVPTGGVARWDGTGWSGMTTGLFVPGNTVRSLAVFDDGSGAALYAGGSFPGTGSLGLRNLARFDGAIWSNVGGGTDGFGVLALAVFDDGAGKALFAGGGFGVAGSTVTGGIARWDGNGWSTVGGVQNLSVAALHAFDDGSGPALYAARTAMIAGVARWNGAAWAAVGGAMQNGIVQGLAAFPAGPGAPPDLYAVGSFRRIGDPVTGLSSAGIARWQGCGNVGLVVCPGDGTGAACPCANEGLPGHGCRNSATIRGAELAAAGFASTSADSLTLRSEFEPAGVTSIFLQGTTLVAPLPFGDGLRCAGGTLKRLYVQNAGADGVVLAPPAGAPSVAERSAELGDPISPGSTRVYQVYYRDPDPSFCPAPQGAGFNVSNGIRLLWMS